jgi:hypothetical protein
VSLSSSGRSELHDLDRGHAHRRQHGLVALLVVLGAFRLLFPGDVPFINDEPLLIESALDANEAGTLMPSGLVGTRGATYGPAPGWFYQLSLAATPDLRRVAVARIIVVTALTGLALTLLAHNMTGLSPVLGAFAFLSPYLWFYARDLWDNSFAIPFSAMLLATYAQFCRDGRLRSLVWVGLFGTLCFLTHLMTLPVVGAVLIHFVATQRGRMLGSWRFALGVLAVSAACVALSLPYLVETLGRSMAIPRLMPSPASVAFSLNGMRLFTLTGFDYVIGAWHLNGVGPIIRLVSLLTYVVGAYGLVLCVRAVKHPENAESGQMGVVLLLALALFVLIANGSRLREHPHYYNGIWIVFFIFWWMGMTRLARMTWARRAFLLQAAVMALFLVATVGWLHANSGTRSLHYGPTLANQMEIAKELEELGFVGDPPSAAHHPRLFPHAIRVLRRLHRRSGPERPSTAIDVEIVYAEPQGRSGAIILRPSPSIP